ncbi:major facilitator transporter [Gordoniibacillus kamchatkensis]|uniref:Major facilitator transporter n=1 Tax=Gordoniibacillus kamchatkensis TaxID=1590651 RepID=A0ABR5ALV1_9BACL|nr:MDR family MFS transporter [Paenibacillus sp. VKM B-2647]KIL41945.1 major facilitator transporter [Paenibacillus sp. VKM B-2647]
MVAKRGHLKFTVAGLLMVILMASMDNTILSTAMGTIVSDLGGLDKFIWVTSAYMVTEMAGMPIFGKLSDMYGRKRFFIFGLIMFLIGSILCGTAHSIVQLSIYRAIQGVGGGALIPIAFTIMFELFPPQKRGQMSGLFGGAFSLSSIFGPLLGAYITDYIGWHWVFFINLPLGFLALLLVVLFYRELHKHSRQKIDWAGAGTLVGAVICLMFALEMGGSEYAWDSSVIIGLFAVFAILSSVFLYVETKAVAPFISFEMFHKRLYATSNLVGMFSGVSFIVATVYIPIFVQGVMGGSAKNTGMVLLPMMLGSTVSARLGGYAASKTSYRNIVIVFFFIFVTGIGLLGTLSPETTGFTITLYMLMIGLGIGASFSVLEMAAIHHFDSRQRASAISTMAFLRQMVMTIGITVFGIIQRTDFTNKLTDTIEEAGHGSHGGTLWDQRAMLTPETRAAIPAPLLEKMIGALSTSITHTFLWAMIPALLSLAAACLMSNDRMATLIKDGAQKKHRNRNVCLY